MGLAAYGKPRSTWIEPLKSYIIHPSHLNYDTSESLNFLQESLPDVRIGLNTLDGQVAFDMAASAQAALESIVLERLEEDLSEYSEYPLCVTGGVALNGCFKSKVE